MPFHKQLLTLLIFVYPLVCIGQPKAGFTVNGKMVLKSDTIRVCAGSTIMYVSTAANFNSILWKFSNGSPSTSSSLSENVFYSSAGLGKAVQIVTDINGRKDSLVANVKVSNKDPNLKSLFAFSPNTGDKCASANYQFTSNSTGNIFSYNWNFGDDSISFVKNPVHQFSSAVGSNGTQMFTVALTVTDVNGCSDISQQNITVLKIPDASLTNQPDNATYNAALFNGLATFQKCEKLNSYQFIFVNSSTTETINTKYVFDWGDNSGIKTVDGNWKDNDTVMHTYTLGLHVLTLSVTDGTTGCAATKKYNVFLGSSPGGAFGPKNNQREFCVGDTGYFNISGYEDNPPGTIYQLHLDDGSVDSIYQQPPPTTVTHVFGANSCTNINGYFTANFYISNPCLTTPIITPQFYVSGKPNASMYISPDTVACLNTELTVYNTSNFGYISNSSGCYNTGEQVWTISPGGYIITGGDLGSLNGSSTDWTKWKNGSSTITIKFTTASVYTIKLYITNQKCGLDSITEIVCARVNPQALFKITGMVKCSSDTVTLQNNSATISCAGDAYKWTIGAMDNLGCGSGAQPSFISGATDTTKSPQVWFKEPGVYTVQLRTTALSTNNTCFAESNDTITIKGKPKVSINPLSAICVGNSINPTAAVTNCYSSISPAYQWSFINGNPGTSNKDVPGTIVYNTVGQQPVKLNVTNECGVSSDSTIVNVIAKPVADAGPDQQLCSGTPVIIGSAPVAGYSYSWLPAVGLNNANISAPTLSLSYNGNNSDTTYKYFVTASIGANCFSVDSVLVIVKKAPDVTTIPSQTTSVCIGGSVMLIAKGATDYVWSPSTYLNTTTNDTVIVKPDVAITYKVKGSLSNGCSDSSNITVSLNPNAKATFTQKFISGCAPFNLDTVINVTTYPDRNLTYNWYANNVLIGSTASGNFPSYILQQANDSVTIRLVTISKFGCRNDSVQQKFYSGIGVNPSFSKNLNAACEPVSVLFTNTSTNLTGTNFLWNFGNGETSNSAQPDTVLFHTGTFHNDTTYYISLTASNGCAIKIIKDSVFVKALPAARFGVNNTFGCSPDTLLINNTSLGHPYKFYWDLGDGNYDTTTTQSVLQHIYSTGVTDTFIIRLTAINNCGADSLPLDVVIAPNNIKAQVNVFGNDLYGCVPHTVTFNNNTTGATTALWSFGDNTSEFLPGYQVNVAHEYTDTGTFNVKVNFTNGCSDTSAAEQVVIYAHPVAAFTTDKVIYCYGDPVLLNISAADGNINRLYWGDDNLFYSPPVSLHYYNNLGNYTIRLYADRVSAYGTVCSDSAFETIRIAERPVTFVSRSNDIDCFTNTTELTATGGSYYFWTPDSTLNNNKIADPVAKPLATREYKVKITGNSGCVVEDSVLVKVDFSNGDNAYLIPSAFTPNGDGLNDCIRIKYPGNIQQMDLAIYNRWGQLLFHATDPSQCWDGTSLQNGNIIKQPPGTYVYTLRIKSICTANTDLFKKGTIVLIR